jgi:photosystem II stability/assembly factor-like uncharacterized protein
MKYFVIASTFLLLCFSTISFAQNGWIQMREEGEDILYTIECLDANIVVAAGSNGLLIRSSDAGATWTQLPSGATDNLRRVRWHSPQLGVLLGNGGVALKSTDAGLTWKPLNTGTSDALLDVHFFDDQNWFAVGRGARIITTSDGGTTWEDGGSGLNNYNEIAFRGDFGIIVGNKGTIRVTNDGGAKWRSRDSPVPLELTSVSIGDDSTAVITGVNGTILLTSDYGRTWEEVQASIPISTYRLSGVRHLTRDRLVIVGYGGIILESLDAGITWKPQVSNTQRNLEAVSFVDSKIGCAAGWYTVVMRTTSGGTLGVRRTLDANPSRVSIASSWPSPLSRSASAVAHVRIDIAKAGAVDLRIYNLLGREVHKLVDRHMSAGSWEIDWDPSTLPKGVYLYRLISRNEVRTTKFTVLD